MDNVNHPSHYTQGGIECIEAIKASLGIDGFCDYCKGNVIKYHWRWKNKGGVEDIQKAQVYLGWMLDSAKAMDWEEEQPSGSTARLDDGGIYCACGNCGLAFTIEAASVDRCRMPKVWEDNRLSVRRVLFWSFREKSSNKY